VEAVARILRDGHRSKAFPAAAIEAGTSTDVIWQAAFGHLTFDDGAPETTLDTVFDLASLTKVIATTSAAMRAVSFRQLDLETPLGHLLPDWQPRADAGITLRHLLDHSSGLPAHARLWHQAAGRAEYLRALSALAVERPAGAAAVYSDPGFILLGFALEARERAPLDVMTAEWLDDITDDLRFLPPSSWRRRTAPTEVDPWRERLLVGEVHDENAAALGGVAGHAGLFGTAPAVGAFARLVLQSFRQSTALASPEVMRRFASRTGVPGSSRALGWDTMLPTSSCGRLFSSTAIGHTGFTGTSLWIDHERDLYVVLLSNRVHPSRANDAFVALRPLVHDAVIQSLMPGG
jgi:serine-type D-Ala-D-Ala carboxypeptidase